MLFKHYNKLNIVYKDDAGFFLSVFIISFVHVTSCTVCNLLFHIKSQPNVTSC